MAGQSATDVGTALHGFPKVFPNSGVKGALSHSLLSSAAGWGSAQGVWLSWGAAGACGPKLLAGECGEPQGREGDEFSLGKLSFGLLMGCTG